MVTMLCRVLSHPDPGAAAPAAAAAAVAAPAAAPTAASRSDGSFHHCSEQTSGRKP